MEERSPEVVAEDEPTGVSAQEAPPGQSQLAYRLSALFLLVYAVAGTPGQVTAETLVGVTNHAILLLVSFALAIGLLELRPRARMLTILVAVLGLISVLILSILPMAQNAFSGRILGQAMLGFAEGSTGSIALLLLLTGRGQRWRIIAASVLFAGGLLITLWNLIAVSAVGLTANTVVLAHLAAATLLSAAILVRYIAREGQARRWTVLLLTVIGLAAWIAGYILSDSSLARAAYGVLGCIAVGGYLNVANDKTRFDVVITLVVLMALLVLLGICRESGIFTGGV